MLQSARERLLSSKRLRTRDVSQSAGKARSFLISSSLIYGPNVGATFALQMRYTGVQVVDIPRSGHAIAARFVSKFRRNPDEIRSKFGANRAEVCV